MDEEENIASSKMPKVKVYLRALLFENYSNYCSEDIHLKNPTAPEFQTNPPMKNLLPIVILVALILAIFFLVKSSDSGNPKQSDNLSVPVEVGPFSVYVNATGELIAKHSEKIRGPKQLRNIDIWQVTISDIVPEGTLVKAGQYVATLDRTEIETKMRDVQTEIDKIQTQLDQTKIDTAIELRGIRDQLVNLEFSMKDKKLELEQSIYEPRSTQQRAEIELAKAKRDFEQLEKKYELSQTKAKAQVSEILASLRQLQNRMSEFQQAHAEFTINAPKDGMVIYSRSWRGKIGPGSQIDVWDPVVAELPDMSVMLSKAYVNEVDISKIQKGQDVAVKVDAFPGKSYKGTVIQVANVGEQLRSYDSKVFEVNIELQETDSILRPAMTTSNETLVYTFDSVMHIPIEALMAETISYVFKKSDSGTISRQEIVVGETNDTHVIVAGGLEATDNVLLSIPANANDLPLVLMDSEKKKQLREKLEKERQQRQQEALEKMKRVREEYQPESKPQSGTVFIFG